MNDSPPATPRLALVPYTDHAGWHRILEASNQVVLYNPSSHALTVTSAPRPNSPERSSPVLVRRHSTEDDGDTEDILCPYCHRPLSDETQDPRLQSAYEQFDTHSRVSDYFHLLASVNESSRPTSPSNHSDAASIAMDNEGPPFGGGMAEGYFGAFFREVRRLGMGANGTVWLCEHVLDGNVLGEPCYRIFSAVLLLIESSRAVRC